ncbi:hypothetical protein OIT44_04170 [Weissella ceti]|uniref:Phage protein n=1 Tax=Weissella ceti TaxID=759620 RepID=A0ABT3E4B0_9LACO|nr:hypothetical protein [Weissella ceti]MCW0953271.1 hypothetical protein [Weissella ceti]QVK11381.1 hypothetical protein KHQ31_03930 [Weissella ceti]
MSNELRIIDEMGQAYPIQDITAEHLAKLSDDDLEQLAYAFRFLEKPTKVVKEGYRDRLLNGAKMWKATVATSIKKDIPDTLPIKQAFLNEYGLDAFELKSPTKLKKQFGQRVEEHIEKVVKETKIKKVKWN